MNDFENLARRNRDDETVNEVNKAILLELAKAGIEAEGPHSFLKERGEVPSIYIGSLCKWSFTRAWRYWVAEGPGVPPDKAEEFHREWGKQVRVEGHCGCPSPLEWNRGFAVGSYHIDTQEGLNAFAELLRSIYIPK